MSDKIESLSIQAGNGLYDSPETLLIRCLQDVREEGSEDPFAIGKKMIVIGLNDNDEKYDIRWSQCGMSMTQCIALVECTKTLLLNDFL